jgi:hypothetical protein
MAITAQCTVVGATIPRIEQPVFFNNNAGERAPEYASSARASAK